MLDDMAADEPGAAGDEYFHLKICFNHGFSAGRQNAETQRTQRAAELLHGFRKHRNAAFRRQKDAKHKNVYADFTDFRKCRERMAFPNPS